MPSPKTQQKGHLPLCRSAIVCDAFPKSTTQRHLPLCQSALVCDAFPPQTQWRHLQLSVSQDRLLILPRNITNDITTRSAVWQVYAFPQHSKATLTTLESVIGANTAKQHLPLSVIHPKLTQQMTPTTRLSHEPAGTDYTFPKNKHYSSISLASLHLSPNTAKRHLPPLCQSDKFMPSLKHNIRHLPLTQPVKQVYVLPQTKQTTFTTRSIASLRTFPKQNKHLPLSATITQT